MSAIAANVLAVTLARKLGTRFAYPVGMEGWVDLCDWLRTEMVYLFLDHPGSKPSIATRLDRESGVEPTICWSHVWILVSQNTCQFCLVTIRRHVNSDHPITNCCRSQQTTRCSSAAHSAQLHHVFGTVYQLPFEQHPLPALFDDTSRLIFSPATSPSTNCYHPRLRVELLFWHMARYKCRLLTYLLIYVRLQCRRVIFRRLSSCVVACNSFRNVSRPRRPACSRRYLSTCGCRHWHWPSGPWHTSHAQHHRRVMNVSHWPTSCKRQRRLVYSYVGKVFITSELLLTLVWHWNSLGFLRLQKYIFAQNFSKQTATIYEPSCPQTRKQNSAKNNTVLFARLARKRLQVGIDFNNNNNKRTFI